MARVLVDQGKLIEAGFAVLRNSMPPDTTPERVQEARLYYLAGCEHVWTTLHQVMDEDREPTDRDMQRMAKLQEEIDAARAELMLRFGKTEGSA
jgi:hypothetical protein